MATDTELLQSALATVNRLGEQLQEAQDALVSHNTDIEAHDDIREALKRIMSSDNIYTNEQILDIINKALTTHKQQSFKDAHTGWDEWESELNSKLDDLSSRITDLSDKLEDYVNGGESTGPATSLNEIIDAINAKYRPRINEISKNIAEAKADGNEELVEAYRASLQATIDACNEEIMQATSDWLASQNGSPD